MGKQQTIGQIVHKVTKVIVSSSVFFVFHA
jgi:hypothetical protein